MVVFKIVPVFLLILAVRAEKKIELQDIEEDNLKSEKQKDYEILDPTPQNGPQGAVPEFLKASFLRYFDNAAQAPQRDQSRFTHQYAVSEAPERLVPAEPKVQYSTPTQQPQQAMVGYLSNVPMQIYLVPQYYNEGDPKANALTSVQYTNGAQYTTATQHHHHNPPQSARVADYSTAPEAVQSQTNYIEVPTYVTPTAKTYLPSHPYPSGAQVTYVSYTPQPSPSPPPPAAPVLAYQVPVVQYSAPVIVSQPPPKAYYQSSRYQDTNTLDEECGPDCSKQYSNSEAPYPNGAASNYPQHYTARVPPRQEYRPNHNIIQELPRPSSLLLKGQPPHLSHIPKALPMYRPLNKPVYGGHPSPGIILRGPSDDRSFKRRPTSLLDSYVPSSLQIEYMKRGFTNDPLQAYEALSSGHHFTHAPAPRHYERGFLPNQIYHTAAGGVTFGQYKRTPQVEKGPQNYVNRVAKT